MMVWKLILDPKNSALTIHEVASLAEKLGYPLFNYEGRIYKLSAPSPTPDVSKPQFEEGDARAEMFQQPDVFCVMDSKLQKIAMNDFGPVLFANPISAQLFAEHVGGAVKTFCEALYLQREAQKKPESNLILPSSGPGGRIIRPK